MRLQEKSKPMHLKLNNTRPYYKKKIIGSKKKSKGAHGPLLSVPVAPRFLPVVTQLYSANGEDGFPEFHSICS